ncbi:MAG: NADH-quinone oxidoreductase subunit N [Planctomycetota bacterium]|jgi:NADH-quinone oxidoreductase subunit N|nr:NADH-quinone oxidoreductase subunit N [Planctomycetota bacterium]MDA1201221.1 NADH-quinone oxidoreductase subunit N [Planctomycetota bacterium]
MTSLESFSLLTPELVLLGAALVAYLGGAFAGLRQGWLVAILGIAAAMAVSGGQPAGGAAVASGPVSIDGFSIFVRWAVLGIGLLLALVQSGDIFAAAVSRGPGLHRGGTCEEAGTFLVMLAGMSLVGVAGDLVLLFTGLELVSIPTYILLGLKRTDARGQEAAIKYFFLSLLASAVFLFGATTLYGIAGTTSLAGIADALQAAGGTSTAGIATVLLPIALGMTVVGTAFRLAAVPMHFYAPDVYEGTSPGNAALLSTLPKLAGVVVLGRLLALGITAEPSPAGIGPAAMAHLDLFWQLTAILAAITMTVGNIMALWQRNLRRLLACSSIAHAGYLLVGVAVAAAAAATQAASPLGDVAAAELSWTLGMGGMSAALFYLATYVLPTIGIFGAVAYLGHRWPEWTATSGPRPPREEITTVDDLDGLSGTNPVAAFAIALFTLSLAGIPPLPGFWGKFTLAASALKVDWTSPLVSGSRRAWFVSLAVILAVNAAIAAAYYLRIIAAMYFKSTKRGVQADGGLAGGLAMLACLVLVAMLTVQPRGLLAAATRAGKSLTSPVPAAVADESLAQMSDAGQERLTGKPAIP